MGQWGCECENAIRERELKIVLQTDLPSLFHFNFTFLFLTQVWYKLIACSLYSFPFLLLYADKLHFPLCLQIDAALHLSSSQWSMNGSDIHIQYYFLASSIRMSLVYSFLSSCFIQNITAYLKITLEDRGAPR